MKKISKILLASCLIWSCLLCVSPITVSAAQSETAETVMLTAEGQWQDVENLSPQLVTMQQLIREGKAKKAQKQLSRWIKDNEDSPWMDQALFLKAQALFDRSLYYQSFEVYEELLDSFPTSALWESSLRQQIEIAKLFLAGKKRKVWGFIPASARTEALEILERVEERWPGSDLAAYALKMQSDYYFNSGRFIEAQGAYQILVDNYNKSRYYEESLLRSAEATQAQYRGPLYDGRCLNDARIRYEQYRVRFPQKAKQLGIEQRIMRIHWQQAEKNYEVADYYQRTHRDMSARYYAEYVKANWAGSEWAQKADVLLAKVSAQ